MLKKMWLALAGVAMVVGVMAVPAAAAVGPPTCGQFPPKFTVATLNNVGWGVFGDCFHTGAPITVTADDPNTAQNPDHTVDVGLSDATGSFNMANAGTPPLPGVPNGYTVTVSDGNGFTIIYVVTNLTVTAVNAGSDTVSGTADPGSRVRVHAAFHWPKDATNATEMASRNVTADGSGNWIVNFSVAAPEDNHINDIRPGTGIWADQINPDPPVGWVGEFPFQFWNFASQNWVIRQLQPQTKDDCKQGNWAYVIDTVGNQFKNQGDCVSFVATGGKNPGKGGPLG